MLKKAAAVLAVLICVLLPGMCTYGADLNGGTVRSSSEDDIAPVLPGLVFEKSMPFRYAQEIDIYYYQGGYKLYEPHEERRVLQVPEGKDVPDGLDPDILVLKGTPGRIYMAATAIMALFRAMDGMDAIRFSSLKAEGWVVEEAAEAMEKGSILYAGKYSEPDYEMLLSEDCDLAVESTMIYHSPKVQEMLESLGIPVWVDRSSYEAHPLGRTEWIKVYGALTGREEQAEAFFDGQAEVMDELADFENTGKTVAFFYMNTTGTVVVRRNDDSVPRMIELAGGQYALAGLEVMTDSKKSSVNMTMEEFYDSAVDADYLVYNGTIDAPLTALSDLLEKNGLFADFKAVREGHVWCADKVLYQATDITGELIRDFHHMLTDGNEEDMQFLRRLQ